MKKYFLLLAVFVSFFYLSQNASATYGAGFCVDSCGSCNAYLWSLNPDCTNVRCSVISCTSGRSDCEREFRTEGTSCSGGACCSGLCGSDPRTDTQCQNKVCGSSGWSASNKVDGTACTKGSCIYLSSCQSGLCTQDSRCFVPCTATLSVSSSGTAPCTVSASVSATGCDGQTFEIKDSAGNSKCAGLIAAGSGTCPSTWSISAGTTYNLYLSGSAIPSDTKTASCGLCTSCSADGTPVGACNSAGQRCDEVSGICSLWTDSSCTPGTITDNCPAQTTKSLCDLQMGDTFNFDCGWCPNSYSGLSNVNGGACMKAENLAADCGG